MRGGLDGGGKPQSVTYFQSSFAQFVGENKSKPPADQNDSEGKKNENKKQKNNLQEK